MKFQTIEELKNTKLYKCKYDIYPRLIELNLYDELDEMNRHELNYIINKECEDDNIIYEVCVQRYGQPYPKVITAFDDEDFAIEYMFNELIYPKWDSSDRTLELYYDYDTAIEMLAYDYRVSIDTMKSILFWSKKRDELKIRNRAIDYIREFQKCSMFLKTQNLIETKASRRAKNRILSLSDEDWKSVYPNLTCKSGEYYLGNTKYNIWQLALMFK